MGDKTGVRQDTVALMAMKTLQALGPLQRYGIAHRIEQNILARFLAPSKECA